jgi:hypothetical protein
MILPSTFQATERRFVEKSGMEQKQKLGWMADFLWIMLALLVAATWNVLILGHVNTWMHIYFSGNIMLAMLFGWWFVQVHQSPFVRSFWVKFPIMLANIPLFFFLLTKIGFYTKLFDALHYIPEGETLAYISGNASLETVMFIKRSGLFWSATALFTTVMVSLRFVGVIFSRRQIPLKRLYR